MAVPAHLRVPKYVPDLTRANQFSAEADEVHGQADASFAASQRASASGDHEYACELAERACALLDSAIDLSRRATHHYERHALASGYRRKRPVKKPRKRNVTICQPRTRLRVAALGNHGRQRRDAGTTTRRSASSSGEPDPPPPAGEWREGER